MTDADVYFMNNDEVLALVNELLESVDDIPVLSADGITYSNPGVFLESVKRDITGGVPVVRELALCHLGKFLRCLRLARACESQGVWEAIHPAGP